MAATAGRTYTDGCNPRSPSCRAAHRVHRVNTQTSTVGALLVVVAALLFAAKGTLIKYIYGLGADVADVMVLRLLFSIPVYLWVAVRHWPKGPSRPGRGQWLGVVASGISGYYVASFFDMLGLQYISVGLERVILYTYPAFVVLFSALLFRRRMSLPLLGWIGISYIGLFMVFYSDIQLQHTASATEIVTGSIFVLLSAVTFAFYVIGGERAMQAMSSAMFTAVAMLSASVVMTGHYALFNSPGDLLRLSWPVHAWCLLLALVFTVTPAFMLSSGIRRIGSAKAGGIGMVGPLGTLVIAALVLGETVTVLQVSGFAIVMLAIHRLHRV